jgi:hypothetical protein
MSYYITTYIDVDVNGNYYYYFNHDYPTCTPDDKYTGLVHGLQDSLTLHKGNKGDFIRYVMNKVYRCNDLMRFHIKLYLENYVENKLKNDKEVKVCMRSIIFEINQMISSSGNISKQMIINALADKEGHPETVKWLEWCGYESFDEKDKISNSHLIIPKLVIPNEKEKRRVKLLENFHDTRLTDKKLGLLSGSSRMSRKADKKYK